MPSSLLLTSDVMNAVSDLVQVYIREPFGSETASHEFTITKQWSKARPDSSAVSDTDDPKISRLTAE